MKKVTFANFKAFVSLCVMNSDTENVKFEIILFTRGEIRTLPQFLLQNKRKKQNIVYLYYVHKCGAKHVMNQNLTNVLNFPGLHKDHEDEEKSRKFSYEKENLK